MSGKDLLEQAKNVTPRDYNRISKPEFETFLARSYGGYDTSEKDLQLTPAFLKKFGEHLGLKYKPGSNFATYQVTKKEPSQETTGLGLWGEMQARFPD